MQNNESLFLFTIWSFCGKDLSPEKYFYRPQMKFVKVMFSQVSVHGGGCIPACTGQGCCVYPSMHWAGVLCVSQHALGREGVSQHALARVCVYPNMHWAGGVCLGPGVYPGGVCSGGVCLVWGVCLWGVSAQGVWGMVDTPLPAKYYGIWSTSRRYASYWNVFLFS